MRVLLLFFSAIVVAVGSVMNAHAQGGGKIVGGENARIADWPGFATVTLHSESVGLGEHFCGGTSIAPTWVITAAHCLHDQMESTVGIIIDEKGIEQPASLHVVLGLQDLKHVEAGDRLPVKRAILHPKYAAELAKAKAITDTKKQNKALDDLVLNNGHDIALLELARPWRGKQTILSLKAATDPQVGTRVRVAGFGYTDKTIKSGSELFTARNGSKFYAGSDRLLQAAIEVIESKECRNHYLGGTIATGQVCAGLVKGGRDSCDGDSGGPLVAYDHHRTPYQIGLLSWGKELCGTGKAYGVYTRISSFADWIQQHTGPLTGVSKLAIAPPPVTALTSTELDAALGQLRTSLSGAAQVDLEIRGARPIRLYNRFKFAVRSPIAGRLMIFDISADQKATLIFPNRYTSGRSPGLVDAGQEVIIPSPGHGFDEFVAQEPIGQGHLVALVAPAGFDIESAGLTTEVKQTMETKGFAAVKRPTSYFMRFILQIERALLGPRANSNTKKRWAFSIVENNIVR